MLQSVMLVRTGKDGNEDSGGVKTVLCAADWCSGWESCILDDFKDRDLGLEYGFGDHLHMCKGAVD